MPSICYVLFRRLLKIGKLAAFGGDATWIPKSVEYEFYVASQKA